MKKQELKNRIVDLSNLLMEGDRENYNLRASNAVLKDAFSKSEEKREALEHSIKLMGLDLEFFKELSKIESCEKLELVKMNENLKTCNLKQAITICNLSTKNDNLQSENKRLFDTGVTLHGGIEGLKVDNDELLATVNKKEL